MFERNETHEVHSLPLKVPVGLVYVVQLLLQLVQVQLYLLVLLLLH